MRRDLIDGRGDGDASAIGDIGVWAMKYPSPSSSTYNDRDRTTDRAESMGFIFQTYNLLPVLSGVENVELPLVVSGVVPVAEALRYE